MITPTDFDGDGVLDSVDLCPSSLPNSSVDASGCVLPTTGQIFDGDTDGDGVPDGDDDCPTQNGGGSVDQFGCPFEQQMNTVQEFFDDVFDEVITPTQTPTTTQSPQTTTSGSSSTATVVSGVPDSIIFLGVVFLILLSLIAVLIKSGKVKL